MLILPSYGQPSQASIPLWDDHAHGRERNQQRWHGYMLALRAAHAIHVMPPSS